MNIKPLFRIESRDILVAFSAFICCYWVYDYFLKLVLKRRTSTRLEKLKHSLISYEMEQRLVMLSFKKLKTDLQNGLQNKLVTEKQKVNEALKLLTSSNEKQYKKEDKIFVALLKHLAVSSSKPSNSK